MRPDDLIGTKSWRKSQESLPTERELDRLKRIEAAARALTNAVESEAARQAQKAGMSTSEWRAFLGQQEYCALDALRATLDEKGGE